MKISGIKTAIRNTNTGKVDVIFDQKITKGGFLIPHGTKVTAADMVDPSTFIKGKLHNDSDALRWRYVGPFESFDDKSEAPQTQTLGYGKKIFTSDGKIAYEYTYTEGGVNNHLNIMDFNGQHAKWDWLPHDNDGTLYGAETDDNTGWTGYDMETFFVYPIKAPNLNAIPEYRIAIGFSSTKQLNQNLHVEHTELDFPTFFDDEEVLDVEFTDVTPGGASAGVFHVGMATGGGAIDLVNLLQSALAQSGAYNVKNSDTGAAITVTSVALNGTKTAVVFTLDTADTDYPAAGDLIEIDFVAVSALAALATPLKYYAQAAKNYPFTVAAT